MIDHIRRAAAGVDLTFEQSQDAVDEIMAGRASQAQVAGLLVALAMKGESADEIAGAARSMRRHALGVASIRRPIVDVCGTGGDGLGTFNISTAVAFVVAGAGVAVAKHGNRAMSSRCGSSDVLEALGVDITQGADCAAASLDEDGIAFLFAQAYHPAMRFVAPVRRELGIRTLFNVIGPLSNPAGAHRQIVGVPRSALVPLVAAALGRLGSERAAAISGHGGMDELSLDGPSLVAEWTGERVIEYAIDPQALGFAPHPARALAGGEAHENAGIIRSVLGGERGARRDVVVLNAALALSIAGSAASLPEGIALAKDSIDSGAAGRKLDALLAATAA
ncbi:MAG TPA: anthranilate phosphoribosyltransferase [Candidatus Eremiobacteraceae bacterium]|nr:anthranilate phosphoribosyltransferase [Candidatus Eremiobacteraceae bacterium]